METTPGGFPITYRIRNNTVNVDPPRTYEVQATQDEIAALVRDGYIVRERLITGDLLEELRDAADEIAREAEKTQGHGGKGGFGGLFVRSLIDKHPTFLKLVNFAPTLSVARAVLGPQVQIHASVLRVAYPEEGNQQVEWHFHQRVVPDLMEDGQSRGEPPFFFRPVVLDNLIYLDDLNPDSGPLVVLPGTHRENRDLPSGDFGDKPGQVVVTCPAGSCVTSHSSLWHKAMPTLPTAQKRRLLILGYSPVWMKQIDKPSAGAGRGLTDTLVPNADAETRELLGLSGWY